jgi:hypothetical protein
MNENFDDIDETEVEALLDGTRQSLGHSSAKFAVMIRMCADIFCFHEGIEMDTRMLPVEDDVQ